MANFTPSKSPNTIIWINKLSVINGAWENNYSNDEKIGEKDVLQAQALSQYPTALIDQCLKCTVNDFIKKTTTNHRPSVKEYIVVFISHFNLNYRPPAFAGTFHWKAVRENYFNHQGKDRGKLINYTVLNLWLA